MMIKFERLIESIEILNDYKKYYYKGRAKDLEKFLKWAMENGATENDFKLALEGSQGGMSMKDPTDA
jgi:hypothetical protein